MMRKTKVLMVLGNTGRGGAQTFAINVLRLINKQKYQIDFVANEIKENGYTQEIYNLGSKIHIIPFFNGYNWVSYVRAWDKLLKENYYDIVHGHVSSSASIYLKEARKFGCKTIVHSHSAGYRGNKFEQAVKKIFTLGAKKQADYWFACSKPAAERLFGYDYDKYEHYYDIPNAIIVEDYLFNEKIRNRIRKELGLSSEQKLYGHVGSFTSPKNHMFLIEIFMNILKNDSSSKLILAGDGELRSAIEAKVTELNIKESVYLLGNVGNVNEYMMAMDAMIFPSLFEGFPVAVLEAQAAGLPIALSNTITNEVYLTECVHPLSLDLAPEGWATELLRFQSMDRVAENAIIAKSRYNMRNCVEEIETIYQKIMSE